MLGQKSWIPLLLLLLCLPLLSGCTSRKTIVNGLSEKEANEIMVFLASKGIDSTKVRSSEGGPGAQKVVLWDIEVGADQSTEAMAYLNQSGLPRRRGQSLLGIFSDTGLVPSEMQEKIRYRAGLGAQIASTIRKIDGVLDAEVQISFPEEDPLHPEDEKKGKITASVYVKHSGVLDDPNTHLVTKIKRLVMASVTGLAYDNVTVIADRSRYGDSSLGTISSDDEGDREYVKVWSIAIAKESLTRFRLLFFTFIIAVLILILLFVWIGWKVYPILQSHGGLKELFHFHPISGKAPDEGEEGSETEESQEEETPKGETPPEETEEEQEPPTDVT